LGDGFLFGQVWVTPITAGFELRHEVDRNVASETLSKLEVGELRDWSRLDARGAFRPLKGAPDLRRGWRTLAEGPGPLEMALEHLYPGGLADWYYSAVERGSVVPFRVYAERQTGMYRGVRGLTALQTIPVVRACCGESMCLKRRLWLVDGMSEDSTPSKSVIPCLEPCAVFLEFARREARMVQEAGAPVVLSKNDVQTLLAVLEATKSMGMGAAELRAGDTGAPLNPRRILLALEHLRVQVSEQVAAPGGSAE